MFGNTIATQMLIGLMICVFAYFVGLIKWIRPAFEDENKEASHKRIFPFLLILLSIYMVLFDKIPEADRKFVFTACLICSAVYTGILTVAQLYLFFSKFSGGKEPEPIEDKPDIKAEVTIKNGGE